MADEIKIDTSNDLITNLKENVQKEASQVLHSYEPLDENIEKENEENLLDKPEYVTWGCYMKVRKEKDDKIITYHLPLESDKSRELWLIERKLLGKQVGHRIYLSGSWYELLEFGWEEDFCG